MDELALERIYREGLEERIISYLSELKSLPLERAMHVYYNSALADKINRGVEGIQYLDYKALVQILCETEPEVFTEGISSRIDKRILFKKESCLTKS